MGAFIRSKMLNVETFFGGTHQRFSILVFDKVRGLISLNLISALSRKNSLPGFLALDHVSRLENIVVIHTISCPHYTLGIFHIHRFIAKEKGGSSILPLDQQGNLRQDKCPISHLWNCRNPRYRESRHLAPFQDFSYQLEALDVLGRRRQSRDSPARCM